MNAKMIIHWNDGNINIRNTIGKLEYTVAVNNYSNLILNRTECHIDELPEDIKSLELFTQHADMCIWEDGNNLEFSYHKSDDEIAFIKMDNQTKLVNILHLSKSNNT